MIIASDRVSEMALAHSHNISGESLRNGFGLAVSRRHRFDSNLRLTFLSKRGHLRTCLGQSLRSCVKVELATLGSPSPIALMVSVDVKQH